MTDDIVARLRQYRRLVGGEVYPEICGEAADEIERLRLEMSIPRDEYAMTWKNLLDRIDGLDIVEWIRAYANAYSPSDYSSPIAREVVVRSDKRWLEAAAEIERLRAERDEARRLFCKCHAQAEAIGYAEGRGWDCFKEAGK